MEGLQGELKANTTATNETKANTAEIVEIFNSWQGAMRVLGYIGKAAKPLSYIVGLCATVAGAYATFKGFFK